MRECGRQLETGLRHCHSQACADAHQPELPPPPPNLPLRRRVQGLDATAARTFVSLNSRLGRMGVQLIIAHTPRNHPAIKHLLHAQGLVLRQPAGGPARPAAAGEEEAQVAPAAGPGAACLWFPSMNDALQFCEERWVGGWVGGWVGLKAGGR